MQTLTPEPAAAEATAVASGDRAPRAAVSTALDLPTDLPLTDPRLYINRELSWLDFNRRVLEEAEDPSVPLLERLKFIAIVSSNLDEFFMVRVANLMEKVDAGITSSSGGDAMLPRDQLQQISAKVSAMVADQIRCLHESILPKLAEEGIGLSRRHDLNAEERRFVRDFYRREIYPILTPLAVDPSHPFPRLMNGVITLAIRLCRPESSQERLAFVQVPTVVRRFVPLPRESGHQFLPLEGVIRLHLADLFPGMNILSSHAFRVTRDHSLDLDEDEEVKDLFAAIERQIRESRKGDAVRLEIEEDTPDSVADHLRDVLKLEPQDVYRVRPPLDLRGLFEVVDLAGQARLREPTHVPRLDPIFGRKKDIWSAIKLRDHLFHHPYDSYKPVIDFINQAADDPNVLAIKQTLYRTSSDSPFIRALKNAAYAGKQVTAIVELKARMEEERNIIWARELERAGVHVVYGFVGWKTHCKVALVVRRDEDRIRRYVHLATGNYNPDTARIYTDIGLLTCQDEITEDASQLFNYLTGFSAMPSWKKLVLAPSQLHEFLINRINREASWGERGRIVAKVNAVLEPRVIQALYAASKAGVRIDLVCRGICALRPGIPGISETIRVLSIVDRFLEHSRIFYFGNDGDPEVYVGSADWMDRNLVRRVEVVFPIEQPELKARLIQTLSVSLADNVKTRRLHPDGSWEHLRPSEGEPAIRSQEYFLRLASQDDGRGEVVPPLDTMMFYDPNFDLDALRRLLSSRTEDNGE